MNPIRFLTQLRMSTAACAYTAVLVLSSPFGRVFYNYMLDNVGRTVVGLLIWSLFILSAVSIVGTLRGSSRARILQVVLLFAFGLGYAITFDIMEERMHLFLFGVLGWLVVQSNQSLSVFRAIALAVMIGFIVGAIDEAVQTITPGRVGDWRDVVFNVVGALWGASLGVAIIANAKRNVAEINKEVQGFGQG